MFHQRNTFTPTLLGIRTGVLNVTQCGNFGCQTNPYENLQGTGISGSVTLSPSSLTFGTVAVGLASAQTIVVVTQGTLHVSRVTTTDTTEFAPSPQNCSLVAAGKTCNITVTFTPKQQGALTATLLVYDDGLGSPQSALLSRNGGPPPPPVASPSPASLTFPKQVAGSASAPQPISLRNTGGASLQVSGVSVTGANPADFVPTSNCSLVAPGGTCNIGVTFTPGATGPRTATLLISDNAVGSPQPVTLSGIGVASCDINGDGKVNVLDVQLLVNQTLGILPATGDIDGDGRVVVTDVQLVVNAALARGCNH